MSSNRIGRFGAAGGNFASVKSSGDEGQKFESGEFCMGFGNVQ